MSKALCMHLPFFFFFTLQYCIGFAIHQHESATGVHMLPILNPPPKSNNFPIYDLFQCLWMMITMTTTMISQRDQTNQS